MATLHSLSAFWQCCGKYLFSLLPVIPLQVRVLPAPGKPVKLVILHFSLRTSFSPSVSFLGSNLSLHFCLLRKPQWPNIQAFAGSLHYSVHSPVCIQLAGELQNHATLPDLFAFWGKVELDEPLIVVNVSCPLKTFKASQIILCLVTDLPTWTQHKEKVSWNGPVPTLYLVYFLYIHWL